MSMAWILSQFLTVTASQQYIVYIVCEYIMQYGKHTVNNIDDSVS